MNKTRILSIIPREGRRNIREAKKRLDQLLEITQCIICKESKPLSEFAEDKNGYLGFSNVCQLCSNKMSHSNIQCKCELCGEFKNYDNFYKIRGKDYYKYCIECTRKVIDERALEGITKQCTECGQEKLATTEYFYVTITCKDLLKPLCKICDNKRKKKSRESKNLNR